MKTKQISIFLEHSKKELQRYNSTKKVIHLQQMGEKIWNAFNYLLERISNKEIWTHAQIYTTAHNLKDKDILIFCGYFFKCVFSNKTSNIN